MPIPGRLSLQRSVAASDEELGVDIEEGHLTSALCHLGNIAYRVRRSIQFDPANEKILGDSEAGAMLTRNYREPFVVPSIAQST